MQIANANLSPCRIDFLDFMADTDVDPLPLPKLFRRADNQCTFFVDNPADIIGDTSGGIGGVRASLENDDVQVGSTAFGLGCGAHPRGITADDLVDGAAIVTAANLAEVLVAGAATVAF